MNDSAKKTIFLNTRIRESDRVLLEAISDRCNWTLSETIRRAIVDEANILGLQYSDGLVIEIEKPIKRDSPDARYLTSAIRRISQADKTT